MCEQAQTSYNTKSKLYSKIDFLPTNGCKWKYKTITSQGDWLTEEGSLMPPEELELWYHDPIQCIHELLGNPAFKDFMAYMPEKMFMDANESNPAFDQAWTGEKWWSIQVRVCIERN
jgi:hypothetical protein